MKFKIGQLVMLVKRDEMHGQFPPLGSVGEVVERCPESRDLGHVGVHVHFPHHPWHNLPDWWHIPQRWLIKIEDPDAIKAEEEEDEIVIPARKMKDSDLVRLAKRILEKVD